MPRVAIDPVSRTIRVDDRIWPFEWEPAAATAAIVLDGRRFELQTMTWRQKCNLARAARKIGPSEDALGAALASACLPPRTALPDSADERAALIDLARWLVSDENVAPWEPVTLARITVDVCRATKLTPQVLDTLPAAEVEAMWSVAHEESRPTRAVSLDAAPRPAFTRIVVLPDSAPAAAPHTEPAPSPEVVAGQATATIGPAATADVAVAGDSDVEAQDDSSPHGRTIPSAKPAPAVDEAWSRRATRADRVAPRIEIQGNRPLPRRLRVSRVTARIQPATPPVVRREQPPHKDTASADTLRARAAVEPHTPAADGEPSARQSRADDREPASAIASSRPPSGALHTQVEDAPRLPAAPAYDPFISDADPFTTHEAPPRRTGADPFSLFDDVERAAVEAGIDLEG